MPTTFILHGGETTRANPDNELFFRYFTQFVDKTEVRIVMCYFAKDKATWPTRLEADRQRIAGQTTKKFTLLLADDPADLLQKLDTADALYVAGGHAKPIEDALPGLKQLGEKLKGKVYLGCSMGAFIVSSHFVLSHENTPGDPIEVHHGLGLLQINTLCHWDVEEQKELKSSLLIKEAPQLPILTLAECKSTVFIH